MSNERRAHEPSLSRAAEYRETMERFTREGAESIAGILSEADFKSRFPHLFGHPHDLGEDVCVRNRCGLWLRKAQLHTTAVLRANQSNNLHSMAVQSRVLLECAAPIISLANAAVTGSAHEFNRIINAFEYEAVAVLRATSRDRLDLDTLQALIVDARKSIGDHRTSRPKRVTIADRLKPITTGPEWYGYLSEQFYHFDADSLMGSSITGGVLQPHEEANAFSFGFFLDYLAGLLFMMIGGYGMLLIGARGDPQVFDDAMARLEQKRTAARAFMQDASGDGL